MGNRIKRTVLFAASALLSMSAFGAGAARFGTLRNMDWVVTNAWQAVSNKTHDLILEIGQGGSSTGIVDRALSYGTETRWTDATGRVWEVVIGSRWDIVYKEPEYGSQYLIYIEPSGLGNGKYWEPYSNGYSVGEAKGDEDSTVLVWEGDAITDFTATRTLGLNTNLVGRVALTNDISQAISTNNSAFVSAVLAAPLVGANPSDLSEIAEYGSYGTVGAALLALIAGLAALKRRMASAETAIDGKANLSDLPYAIVTPDEWAFSGVESWFSVGGIMYDVGSGKWLLSVSGDGWGTDVESSGAATDTSVEFLVYEPNDPFRSATVIATKTGIHLLDRAVNAVPVSTDTTLTLPALVNAGKARDFLVRLAISGSTVPTITFVAPTGETITYETDGDEFPVPDAEGTWLYSFTETVAHTFAVSLKQLQSVSQPVTQGGS